MDALIKRDLTVRGIIVGSSANTFWKDIRYYLDSSVVMYACHSTVHKASTSDGDKWHIWKYSFDVDGNVIRIEGPIIGNADSHASLGWGE
jgi:hypothetical protein